MELCAVKVFMAMFGVLVWLTVAVSVTDSRDYRSRIPSNVSNGSKYTKQVKQVNNISWQNPSKHVFGSLDFSLLEEEGLNISFEDVSLDDVNGDGFVPKGISVSFYIDSIPRTEEPQKILSVYGADILLNKENSSLGKEECRLTVVTQLKFNITYTLDGCERRFINLDLYKKGERKTCDLYDNLTIKHGKSARGWCKYLGYTLEESKEELHNKENYTYPRYDKDGNDNLDKVKGICLTDKSVDGRVCRGITLKNGNYSLRVGDYPTEDHHSDSYLNGPCIDERRQDAELSQVLKLHKVDSKIVLSHINIDPLRDVTDNSELYRRWERFEIGNMVRGKLVNYDHITYNSEYDDGSNVDKLKSMYIPPSVSYSNYSMSFFNYKNSGIDLRRLSFPNVVVSEGMFIQEEFKTSYNEKRDGKFFQIFSDGDAYDVNFLWRDTDTIYIELRYCTRGDTASKDDIESCLKDKDCHGISSDKEMIKNVTSTSYIENAVMWKGFCSEGEDSLLEHSKFDSIPPFNLRIEPVFRQRMAAHQFRFLPKANNVLTRKEQEMCTFISSHNFVNDMTALLSFKRSTDGFRLEITAIAEDRSLRKETKFVRLNESEDQTAIMHKITFNNSVESIKLLAVTNEACHLDIVTLTADTCEPEFLQNDFGYYFLNRLTYVKGQSTKANYDCTVDSSKHSVWECRGGSWHQSDNSECPFYQCYESRGRRHNPDYTNKTSFYQILKKGGTASDECCGDGRWTLDCQDENFTINYDNCTPLKSCTGEQTFEFEVSEDSGKNTNGSVVMSEFMAANSKKKLSCGYGDGSVTIKCDGCSGIRTLEEENSCTSQVCLQESKNEPFNFIRDDDGIKYNGTDFLYTLEGPFNNGAETVIVPCPHGGHIEINCEGDKIIPSFTKCTPAPKCGTQDIELSPLKGKVTVEEIFAGDSVNKSCPINNEANARIDCNVFGEWVVGDDSGCDMGPCSAATFEKDGIRFSVGETALNTLSVTKCYHASCSEEDDCPILDMCIDGTCGAKLCNPAIGGYEEEANFDTCRFNCTFKDEVTELESIIEHGAHKRFQCVRKNGSPGKRYVECDNGRAKPLDCVLITCPYGGGVGCVETNPEALKKADSTELAKDLSNFLEKVDLSAPKAKADTKNVVNAIMSNAPSGTMGVEDKANIAAAVDKVSMALAKSGGSIASVGVTMFGIPSTKTRKRSTEENNYLAENGIEGENFNGSVGLSIYKDKELFRPLNETKEKLLSYTVASVTTEFESRDINVNLSFPLMMECNTTFMSCSYFDPTTGQWLEDGVKTICDGTKMICQSSHLTSFAVLVSLDDIASREQSIVSTILLTISVACLSATAMSFIPFRKLRNRDIIKIHLGLIFSSIIANLSFLSMEASSGTAESCFMSAFITHYAWLSVFGWMLAEGVTMYRQTVRALKSYGKKIENYTLKCAIVIHTLALIPPVLGTILHFTLEPMTFQYVPLSVGIGGPCFLHKPLALSLLFLLPLYLMLCGSIYFFIRVSLVVVKSKRQSTSKSVDQGSFIKKQAKAISSIATATGIAWVVAAFVNLGKGGSYSIIMQWVFLIFLSSQGIITFLVLVAVSDEVKGCWKEAYKGSSIEKFGDAFISMGAGLGTLHSKRKSKKKHTNGHDNRSRKDTGNTLLEQTRSTNFFSNLGKSREFLFTNLFSKAHSSDLVNEYSTHSTNHSRSQTPHDVFSPVEEVSSIFQGSDSWVKFVERAEDGILPSEVASSAVVSRSAIASDSGFHGEEDMSTSL